jgi:hypothetical protein
MRAFLEGKLSPVRTDNARRRAENIRQARQTVGVSHHWPALIPWVGSSHPLHRPQESNTRA